MDVAIKARGQDQVADREPGSRLDLDGLTLAVDLETGLRSTNLAMMLHDVTDHKVVGVGNLTAWALGAGVLLEMP